MGQIVAMVGLLGIALAFLVSHQSRGQAIHSETFEYNGVTYRLTVYQHQPLHYFVALPDGREILEGFADTVELAQQHALEQLAARGL